ncbi:MAG TPA: MarR family transcriptional regulator [Stackebrandtia sp.]|uniref:GbsR/MarR family transcriptional regulator n=1 Tax=Stackebrandtia sp. TaxID=2023065 RepID=UPI002D341591|nr:MarR family transcriptional regulator [Stackebrandtia sp.]HZE38180.1 MarR family transcriptional regulator [Stackebrandtia sp.]
MAANERTRRHDYADEVGLYFEQWGLPRIPGRILGWLLVCEPPHQSAEELAGALSVSRGSISMALKMLTSAGVVERHPAAGSRRTYYHMTPGFWLNEAGEKARAAAQWTKLAERGLELMADRPADSRDRLREMRDSYAFLAEQYARIETLWHERQRK